MQRYSLFVIAYVHSLALVIFKQQYHKVYKTPDSDIKVTL